MKDTIKFRLSAIESFAKAEGKLGRHDGIVKSGCGVHQPKKGKGSYRRNEKHKKEMI